MSTGFTPRFPDRRLRFDIRLTWDWPFCAISCSPMKVLAYIVFTGLFFLIGSLLVIAHFDPGDASAVSVERFETKIRQILTEAVPYRTAASYESSPEADQERLNLAKFLPNVLAFDREEVSALIRLSETCHSEDRRTAENLSLRKAFIFAEYVCGLTALPEHFFENAPYIHPFGRSFVARAHQLQPEKFDAEWLNASKNYLHVVEFHQIYPGEVGLFKDPAELKLAQRRAWVSGSGFIVGDETIWMLNGWPSEHQRKESIYNIYGLSDLNRSLSRIGLKMSPPDDTKNCLIAKPGYCVRTDTFGERARSWAVITTIGSATVVFLTLVALFSFWRINKGKARKERLMILQILAHELRTPATSMGISLDLLRTEFDRLTPEGQTSYLRMADDNRRLIRLIEGSRSYLTSDSSTRYLKEKIELTRLLERVAQPYENQVTIELPEAAHSVMTHPDWLSICLTNLLENAIKHGADPVVLRLLKSGSHISITIEDKGRFAKNEFLRLKGEFRRGSKSTGMGLGLAIVLDTLTKLGHPVEFLESPTRFTIKFEEA